jgi:hypothetical protein
MNWRVLSAVLLLTGAAAAAQEKDKEPVVTKKYKADFGRVKDGELPEGWEVKDKRNLAVSKIGGRARLVTAYDATGAIAYAAVDDKLATFGTDFDLVLDLTTPRRNPNANAQGRFELVLPGVGGGKDLTFDIAPNAKGDAYEMSLAGETAVTTPFPSKSDTELNGFRLTIQRRGDTLSMTSNANKKEKFLVGGKPAETIPVPEGVKGCAGVKIGIAQQNYANATGYEAWAFQLHGLEVRPVEAGKAKK